MWIVASISWIIWCCTVDSCSHLHTYFSGLHRGSFLRVVHETIQMTSNMGTKILLMAPYNRFRFGCVVSGGMLHCVCTNS